MDTQQPTFEPGRPWGLLVTVILLVVGGTVAAVWLYRSADYPQGGMRVEELKADMDAKLPDGSTREQAIAWFATHRIEWVRHADEQGGEIGLGAKIPNGRFLESADIHIRVYFADDGTICKRSIERVVYWP